MSQYRGTLFHLCKPVVRCMHLKPGLAWVEPWRAKMSNPLKLSIWRTDYIRTHKIQLQSTI